MFYFIWAIKNIKNKAKNSIGITVFIILITTVLLLNYAFQVGTEKQMYQTMRKYHGDIAIQTRSNKYSLLDAKKALENSGFMNDIELIVSSYSVGNAEFITDGKYASGIIAGYSEGYFKWLGKSISWIAGKPLTNARGNAVVERSMARKLGLSPGDKIIVRYSTKEGAINTASFILSGIFTGNKYVDNDRIFVSLKDAQALALAGNKIGKLKIFLKDSHNEKLIQDILSGVVKKYDNIAFISVWLWDTDKVTFVNIFNYFHIFIKILFGLLSIVLLIILSFGIQNSFYIIFNKRRNEISTLVAFGMRYFGIYRMVFWETILLFLTGIIMGIGFSLLLGSILGRISLAQISEEMVVLLGGPGLKFTFLPSEISMVALFIFITGLFSSFYSLRKYFKVEAAQMMHGI